MFTVLLCTIFFPSRRAISFQDTKSSQRDIESVPRDQKREEASYRVIDQQDVYTWESPVLFSEQQEAKEVSIDGVWLEVPRPAYIVAMWEVFGMTASTQASHCRDRLR